MSIVLEALNTAQHRAAEAMYKNASAGASASAGQPSGTQQQTSTDSASTGDVIDAEVVEEEKK